MAETVPDIIRRYFDLAASPDRESYFGLFADDATVEDEGKEHHGIAAIRAWRTTIPKVTYAITDTTRTAEATVVTAEITGDFPGSPVSLTFHFADYDEQHIRVLRIRP